jgi:hypothetical protein
VLQSFVKTSSCLFPLNKLSGYPGNPPASRLPATWDTTTAYIEAEEWRKIEKRKKVDVSIVIVLRTRNCHFK